MRTLQTPAAPVALVALIAMAALGLTLLAQGNTSAITSQLERADQRLKALQQEADQLAREERSLLGDIQRLEVARRIKLEEVTRANAQVAATEAELSRVNDQVARLEAEARVEGPRLRARLVELYKLGRGRYVRVLFSTPSMHDARQAYRLVSTMARLDQERVAAHQQRLADLTAARKEIQTRVRKLEADQADARRAAAAAEQAVAARDALVRDADSRRDVNARLSGELLAAQQRLQRTITAADTAPVPLLPFQAFRGALDWPVAGSVKTAFLRSPGVGLPPLNGVEIVVPEGTPVDAVHEGVVAFANTFTGFGNLVIVEHGGQNFSVYGYLSAIDVARGDRIDKGRRIGTTGSSARGTQALYFELRVDGKPADPVQWLRAR